MNNLNKKGATIGVFVVLFIGIIVSLALFSGTFETVGKMTNIYTVTNETVTTAATGNASTTLTGRENTTAVTIVNATDNTDWSANFTITTTDSGGSLAILLTTTDAAVAAGQNGTSANVSYSYKPDGYNDTTGSRAIIALVLIFGALAIMAFVIPDFRELIGL